MSYYLLCDVPFLICILYLKVSLEESNEEVLGEVSYEVDNLLEASPVTASVLDIIAASGSLAVAEEEEAGGSKIVGNELDGLAGSAGPGFASVLHMEACAEEVGFSGEEQGSLAAENATSSTR